MDCPNDKLQTYFDKKCKKYESNKDNPTTYISYKKGKNAYVPETNICACSKIYKRSKDLHF